MKPRLILLLVLAAGAAGVRAADTKAAAAPASTPPAATAPAPERARTIPPAATATPRNDSSIAPSTPFENFRLISDRNIFNPNRTGRRDRSEEVAPPRVDTISLVGTMESDRGLRAFFDGSDSSFRKALHVGGTVDKYKITKIAPNVVDLERDGKTLSVHVGQQLRRPEGADWSLVGEDVSRREAQARTESRPDPSAPPVIPANVDEVTRRLMERRAKELKN
jgi:hypothetical protein